MKSSNTLLAHLFATLALFLVLTGSGFAQLSSPKNPIVFNLTTIGSTSYADATISNIGSTALTFTLPFGTITGPNASDFKVNLGTLALTLSAGSSGIADLSFTPTLSGNEHATLIIDTTVGDDLVLNLAEAPEPSTWPLILGGLGLLAFWRKRVRRALL